MSEDAKNKEIKEQEQTWTRSYRPNAFGDLLGFKQYVGEPGHSRCVAEPGLAHYSPGKAIHGGFLFAMMDNCCGAALISALGPDEGCATVEMKINYLKAVFGGTLETDSRVVQKSKRIAVLESRLYNDGDLVAIAMATYAVRARPGRVAEEAEFVRAREEAEKAGGSG